MIKFDKILTTEEADFVRKEIVRLEQRIEALEQEAYGDEIVLGKKEVKSPQRKE
jgi:hypothetical protein